MKGLIFFNQCNMTLKCRHDTQKKQHNGNNLDTQYEGHSLYYNTDWHFLMLALHFFIDIQSVVMLSVVMRSVVMRSVVMLSVVMLSVVMLSVVMLSVVMLSVVALSLCSK